MTDPVKTGGSDAAATSPEASSPPAAGAAIGRAAGWLEDDGNRRLAFRVLLGIAALLVAMDLVIHKHGKFAIENSFGFYAWYGLGASVVLVLAARGLRALLARSEDYYDR